MSARCILCFFAPLAVLPGCQQIPYFGAPVYAETKKLDSVVVTKSTDAPPSPKVSTEAPLPMVEVRSPGPVVDPAVLKHSEPSANPLVAQLTSSQAAPLPMAQPAKTARKYDLVTEALQDVLDGRPQDAVTKLQGYDKSTQEFLLNWMPAVVIILRNPIDQMSAQEIAMLNELFTRWSQTVRNHTELVISKMCYCRRVQGFGAYEPLLENHAFLSGTGRYGELVQVYVELKNFVSEQAKEGDYVTKLACSLEIKDSRGERVMFHPFRREETIHRCRSRLNDLHENFSFHVPAMAPGTYLLTVQIVDETLPSHRRVAKQSLPFRVTPVATETPPR